MQAVGLRNPQKKEGSVLFSMKTADNPVARKRQEMRLLERPFTHGPFGLTLRRSECAELFDIAFPLT